MQVRKVAVVATGALATAAAMGSTPAFAADSEGTPEVAPATLGVLEYEGKHRASDEAMRELAEQWLTVAPEQTMSAPWEQEPPQILSVGSGSALSVAPWQMCASHGPFVGGLSVPVASPATVMGDCRNGNIDIQDGGGSDALFSILDGTGVSALAFQMCGSGVGALGATVPIASPTTVGGSCDNGNITVGSEEEDPYYTDPGDYGYYESDAEAAGAAEEGTYYGDEADAEAEVEPTEDADPYAGYEADGASAEVTEVSQEQTEDAASREEGYYAPAGPSAPWEQDAPQILSAGSGSAASGLSWQMCASPGPFAVGGSAPIASPMTVMDDCRNGNLDVHGDGSDALFSALDGSALSVAPFQMCGSGVGAVGVTVPVASPMTVGGGCDNGNITVG